MTKPLHGIRGQGIRLPGPPGRYGAGAIKKPAQQTQQPADEKSAEQLGKTEPPKQAK